MTGTDATLTQGPDIRAMPIDLTEQTRGERLKIGITLRVLLPRPGAVTPRQARLVPGRWSDDGDPIPRRDAAWPVGAGFTCVDGRFVGGPLHARAPPARGTTVAGGPYPPIDRHEIREITQDRWWANPLKRGGLAWIIHEDRRGEARRRQRA